MLECDNDDDHEDREIDTKLAFDPPELTRKIFQAFNQHAPQASLNIT